VICSLWNVSDDAGTVALMTVLYAGLKPGRSAPEALRDAQGARIAARGPPYLIGPIHTPETLNGAKLKMLFSGMSDPYHEAEPGP
jgi:CHAT domain-containing protein